MSQQTICDIVEKNLEKEIDEKQLFHIRVDLDEEDGPTYKDVLKFLESYKKYLCSDIEYKTHTGTPHVHILLHAEVDRKTLRETVKKQLVVQQQEFSTSYVNSLKQCTKYVVKEGYTHFAGIDENFVKKCKKLSTKKAGKKEIVKMLVEARDQYLSTDAMSLQDITEYIIDWHRIHGKTWSRSHLETTLTLWEIQKHKTSVKEYAAVLVNNIYNKFQLFR